MKSSLLQPYQPLLLLSLIPLLSSALIENTINYPIVQPSHSHQIIQRENRDQQIAQIKNFSSYLIEKNETAEFELQNYFSGALLDYAIDIKNLNGTWYFDQPFYQTLIKLTPPYQSIHYQMIDKETFTSQLDPFPSSTLLLSENNGTTLTMYMLDRNFYFYKYDACAYSTGKVKEIYRLQLNTSIVNESCHDLTHVQYGDNQQSLIMFCKSEIYTPKGDINFNVYTIVQIDLSNGKKPPKPKSKTHKHYYNLESQDYYGNQDENCFQDEEDVELPTIRYNSFRQTPIMLDFIGGVKFIGYENYTDGSVIMLFLANQLPGFITKNVQQVIVKLNFTEFQVMAAQGQTQVYNLQSSMTVKYWIKYDDALTNLTVTNFAVLRENPIMVGMIFDHIGVLICQFKDSEIYQPIEWSRFYPPIACNTANSSQLIPLSNALSLYSNPQDPGFFFIALSQPPGVVEVNIEDPYNAYVFTQYQLHQESSAFVGLRTIATNKNLIIHSMLNIETNQQVLRLYNRNASHFNIAKYNYVLPQKSRSNFYMFPSFYQNVLFFRDELRINVTTFFDYKLTLDATNLTWVNVFQYQIFEVNLTVRNDFTSIQSLFNVTFVDENFTKTIAVGNQKNGEIIYYNCGDDNFQYKVSDLFDGPNFNIKFDTDDIDDCDDGGYCYFNIVNQKISKVFESNFTQTNCDQNFIYPDIQNLDNDDSDPVILVCLDSQNSLVSSYKLVQENQTIELLNTIQIPQLKFLYAGANIQERGLFIVAQITDEDWFEQDNEVHFFSIQSQVLWKNFTSSPIDLQGYDLSDLNIFVYNQKINKGVMVSNKPDQTEQIMLYFEVNGQQGQFKVLAQTTMQVDADNETLHVAISQEGFVYALQANQVLNIYQVMMINSEYAFALLKSKKLENDNQIPNRMDIHEDFFIIYNGDNDILVYDIQNYIDLVYRMKLPLYTEYSGFKFDLPDDVKGKKQSPRLQINQMINYDYYDNFLAVLMVNQNYHGRFSIKIFVYSLLDSQHNSLVMTRDVTLFFRNNIIRQIVLTGNQLSTDMVLITDDKLALYEVEFYNYIKLREDEKTRKKLLDTCAKYKNSMNARPLQIANIKVKAQSMFERQESSQKIHGPNKATLNIFSQNQGIAITPVQNQVISTNLYFASSDNYVHRMNKGLILPVEDFLEGYNMNYQIDCNYYDEEENLQKCVNVGIRDYTQSLSYNFYIEFVTQIRQVVKSFTLGRLIIMFDSLNRITVQTLQDYDNDIDDINGNALDMKREYSQNERLGCNIEGFINIYECLWINDEPNNAYTLYLAIYQCKIEDTLYLRMAKIIVYDHSADFEITVLKNQQKIYHTQMQMYDKIPYKIIDIERSNVTILNQDKSKIKVTIGMTLEVPESSSNVFLVQNMTIDIKRNVTEYHTQTWMTAMIVDKDTFKIGQLMSIPNSNLIIIVDKLLGIYIYDLDQLMILKEFDLRKENRFQKQYQKTMGDLKVFTVAGNWPYSIHIITNYGIFIYNFGVNLCDRSQVFPYFEKTLEPIERNIIRYQFDVVDELASNEFGYSFLITKQTSQTSFDVYLVVVSFYASAGSKLFRIIKVSSDQTCLSLNWENSLGGDYNDELTVSFICNTQFYIVKTCLRPRFLLNMQSYLQSSTKYKNGKYVPGSFQFNQFNITVTATNEYNQNGLNQGSVALMIHQRTYPDEKFPEFYLICIFVLCTAITLIMFVAVGGQKVQSEQEKRIAFDDAYLPKMSFTGDRNSTMAVHNSFVKSGIKLLNLQAMNKSNNRKTSHFNTNILMSPDTSNDEINPKIVYNSVYDESNAQKQQTFISSQKKGEDPRFEMLSTEVIPGLKATKLSSFAPSIKKAQ